MSIEYTKELLDKMDFNEDTDAVAVFRPGNGVAFHIPDKIKETVKVGKVLPSYVMSVFVHIYIFQHFEDDPKVKAFADYIQDAIMAELSADEEGGTA